MHLASDYIHPTPRGGRCRIRIYLPEEERDVPVVICSELPSNEDSSVTYSAHQIAAEVLRYHLENTLDNFSEFERFMIADRMRRGKRSKSKQGKLVAGPQSDYGFRYNDARDGYEVDEVRLALVRRIFRMVGVEGDDAQRCGREARGRGHTGATGRTHLKQTDAQEVHPQ
jgi:DNA invertase Pin-like site-specific DNA recombinase